MILIDRIFCGEIIELQINYILGKKKLLINLLSQLNFQLLHLLDIISY